MKKDKLAIIAVMLLLVSVTSKIFGQSYIKVIQLGDALSDGNVTLTARGNGSSSGSVVLGTLKNNLSNEIRINVILNGGLYLKNSGLGQNMIATKIYLSNSSYYVSGKSKFISLPANMDTQIRFTAYCADFELENPSTTENFRRVSIPSNLQSIASKISRYEADNFGNKNLVTPIQLALWRSQGVNRRDIAEKFDFTDADWDIATIIINY